MLLSIKQPMSKDCDSHMPGSRSRTTAIRATGRWNIYDRRNILIRRFLLEHLQEQSPGPLSKMNQDAEGTNARIWVVMRTALDRSTE
jgi:hypothetical protein